MKLGNLSLSNNLLLAPMQNVTTAPYRRFCRHFHDIGLVCVPMIYTKRIVCNPNSIKTALLGIGQEKPISIQLIGNDPKKLRTSIDHLESYEHDVIDINAGCPSHRAINSGEGGYLLTDLKRLKELTETALKYSSASVSLKIRSGFEEKIDIEKFQTLFKDSNLDFLTIHARSVKSKYEKSFFDIEFVKEIKEKLNIPIVGNGDIDNPITAHFFMEYTNVDALMIGRGSMGNPAIFHHINEYLKKRRIISEEPTLTQMEEKMHIYEEVLDKFLDDVELPLDKESYKFTELKRNSIWLTRNIRNSTLLRVRLSKTGNYSELKQALFNIFNN